MRQKYQTHLMALSLLIDQLSEDYVREKDGDVQRLYFDACRLTEKLKTKIKKVEEDE